VRVRWANQRLKLPGLCRAVPRTHALQRRHRLHNLGSYKGQAVRRVIRDSGAKLFFLPAYSPDLNSIEQVFAKLKTLPRKAEERTVEATWKRLGLLLDCFTPAECANYLVNSGYASK
jgi:transposase